MSQNMNNSLKRCLQLRRWLKKSLKDKYPLYVSSVRDWIRKRRTRAELDLEVCSYLPEAARKVHSEFLLTLSKLCCGRMSLRLDPLWARTAALPGDPVNVDDSRCGQVLGVSSDPELDPPEPFLLFKKVYTDREICGLELIKARFYLAAWDRGLTGIDYKVSRVLYYAMQNYIKEIIHAAILHRGKRKPEGDKISGLDVWNSVVRTNCDQPATPYSTGVAAHFRNRDRENTPV